MERIKKSQNRHHFQNRSFFLQTWHRGQIVVFFS